jgi:hypothetical protein
MAKRKTTTKTRIVRVPSAAAPVIKVSAPRAPAKRKTTRRRKSSGGGSGSASHIMKAAVGGAAFGFLEKSFPNLPTVPMLGRAGTIAVAAYFFRGKLPPIAQDIGIAAAAIAGYQLGRDGKVSGDEWVEGDIVPQVSGIAAQV